MCVCVCVCVCVILCVCVGGGGGYMSSRAVIVTLGLAEAADVLTARNARQVHETPELITASCAPCKAWTYILSVMQSTRSHQSVTLGVTA